MRNMWFIVVIVACRIPDEHYGRLPDSGPVLEVPSPRLIAPSSMSLVTLQTPTLRWELPIGTTTPTVELCQDRSCTAPLSIMTALADDNLSAVPTAPLPSGWVFWRVRAVQGAQTATSATWQFWVGKTGARNPVDTSNGAILDVNGDGYPDVLVGSDGSGSHAGVVHLYLGSAAPSATTWNQIGQGKRIDLTSPDGANASFGYSVASAGDVNGDGYADFLVGAYGAGSNAGVVHLYLGSPAPDENSWNGTTAAERIDLIDPDGDGAIFGVSLASAGDVNRDGYADFLVGASKAGVVHLYLGAAAPGAAGWNDRAPAGRLDLASPDGFSAFGHSVTNAGDVDGDGFADFVIGADAANGAGGTAHLYLGSATPNTADWNGDSPAGRIDLTNPDGTTASFGYSVAGAGDVNGDGYADFLVTALSATSNSGVAHLYFGQPEPSTDKWNGISAIGRVDLTNADGASALFGSSAASAGDVNGDGFADFLLGAEGVGGGAGKAHLYLGKAMPSAAAWNAAVSTERIDLANLDGPIALFGSSVAGAGDVNGDGYADFVIGARDVASTGGAAHLYLSSGSPSAAAWNGTSSARRIDLTNPDGAGARFGISVARSSSTSGSRGFARSSGRLVAQGQAPT